MGLEHIIYQGLLLPPSILWTMGILLTYVFSLLLQKEKSDGFTPNVLQIQALYLFFSILGATDFLIFSTENNQLSNQPVMIPFSFALGLYCTILYLIFWIYSLKRSFPVLLFSTLGLILIEYYYEEMFSSNTKNRIGNIWVRCLTRLVLVEFVSLMAAHQNAKKPTVLETFNTICFCGQVLMLIVALQNAQWINWSRLTTISNVANIFYLFYRSLADSHKHSQLNDTIRDILIPNSILVAVVYWFGVCTALPFKREPLWIEIGEHGAFMGIFIIDFILERIYFPRRSGLFTIQPLVLFHACYVMFLFVVKYFTDRWIYDLDATMVFIMPAAALGVDMSTMYLWNVIVKFIDNTMEEALQAVARGGCILKEKKEQSSLTIMHRSQNSEIQSAGKCPHSF